MRAAACHCPLPAFIENGALLGTLNRGMVFACAVLYGYVCDSMSVFALDASNPNASHRSDHFRECPAVRSVCHSTCSGEEYTPSKHEDKVTAAGCEQGGRRLHARLTGEEIGT